MWPHRSCVYIYIYVCISSGYRKVKGGVASDGTRKGGEGEEEAAARQDGSSRGQEEDEDPVKYPESDPKDTEVSGQTIGQCTDFPPQMQGPQWSYCVARWCLRG